MERRIFSARLLEKLAKMRSSRLSVLEAPAGYGKTTAVSHALEGVETVRWYTGVEHLPDTSFYWFIQQLGNEDERTFRRMESISFLNRSNAAQAARILGDVRVERPVTLVFDNFQFAADNWPPQVIDALAKRAEDGLHLIFIAQNLGRLRPVFEAQEGGVCFLREKDLLLTQEDICGLARQGGMSLTRQQAKEVIRGTGGWPAAVSLSLAADGEVGEMDELLYRLFWVRSEERQQTALLRLSLFDCITPAMVDAGKLKFVPAADYISHLTEKEQTYLQLVMERDEVSPSMDQAQRLKQISAEGQLETNVIDLIMREEKPLERKVTLRNDRLQKYFPASYTPKQMEEVIVKLLEGWHRRRQQEQGR